MNQPTKYPNQIDGLFVEPKEAVIAIENILGTNPNGEFSTVNDRLNNINKDINSLLYLSNKEYLNNLNLTTILGLNNTTDGYDLIISSGDSIVAQDGILNLKGNTVIDGGLEISASINLNNNTINYVAFPFELHHAANKQYVDNQITAQNNKFDIDLNNIINKNNNLIQYAQGRSDPFPNPESNKYLKRNIDNTGWEYQELNLKPIYDKFETLTNLINSVSKNRSGGSDILIELGDALVGEGGIINIDSEVFISSALSIKGKLDVEYHNIVHLLDPVNPKDAVTKQYVDDRLPKNVIISDVLEKDVEIYYHEKLFKAQILRLDSGKDGIDKVIHGIKFPDTFVKFTLINIGINKIVLKDNGNTPFGNMITLPNSEDLIIPYDGAVTLFYDNQSSFWRVIYTNY